MPEEYISPGLTPELLVETAKSLFGNHWQQPMAVALKVTPRTLRRWADGEGPVPPRMATEVLLLAYRRADQLSGLLRVLELNRIKIVEARRGRVFSQV